MSYQLEIPISGLADIPDTVVEKAFGLLCEHAQLADGSRLMLDPQSPFTSPNVKPPESDQYTMQLELLITAFQRKTWKKIQTLRRRRNLLSPIHRLPSELLIDIFLLVHDLTNRQNDYEALHQMVQVCCAWHDIILSNSCFWTYVSTQLPLSMNKQIIKLSKDAPLHTDLRYPMCTEVEGKMILECLAQEVSRWNGIICNSSQMVDMIDPIVKDGAATILESFQWTGIDQASCEVPSLIQERAPRLRELAIMDLPLVPLDLPILSRIKVLRFDPSFDMYQSHTHWERLLSSIPEIETLEVHCPYPTATNSLDEEFSIVFDVRLLHLRHLYLYDLPSWISGRIMSSIILDPNQDCPFVSIRLGNEHHEPLPGSFPAISRSSSLLCIIRDSATELIFRGLNRWDVMHQDRDRYIFQFAGDWSTDGDGSEADTLRVVLGPLNNLHLTTLGIQCTSLLHGDTFVSEIHNLPTLESLYIAGFRAFVADDEPEVTMQALSSICEALSAPRAIDGEDTLAWPCPKLTLLYCDSWPDWNPLLGLLRARYGPEASSQCPAPAPLGRITFAGYPDPLPYENIQLVGEMCTLTNAAFAFQT